MFNQGNIEYVAQYNVAEDGNYSYTLISDGQYCSKTGEFTERES
jgi:hypothetical protein